MKPFFIGDSAKQIYTTLVPSKKRAATCAVILFYPYGQEYMRAHKAFRQLATQLSRKGFDTYRFDYPGTGDSYGELTDISFTTVVDDSINVLSNIAATQNYERLIAVGLRFGALVAHACMKSSDKLDQLILWDPFASGKHFIDENETMATASSKDTDEWNVHGFELTKCFRDSISTYSILPISDKKIEMVISFDNENSETIQKQFNNTIPTILQGPKNDWNYVDMVGSILMPTKLISCISEHIDQSS